MSAPQLSPPNTGRDDGAVILTERRASKAGSRDQLPVHQGDVTPTSPIDGGEEGSGVRQQMKRKPALVRIKSAGESGRSGFHPLRFFRIAFRSSSTVSCAVNVLWPVVPAAIAVRYALPDNHLAIFILAYIAMVPCANLVGFAGQELARKVPHVLGVLTETTRTYEIVSSIGSVVEIVLFMVLITRPESSSVDYIQVIKAAILGSVLATMLLCLGLCFIAGGFTRHEQTFNEAVSEAGSGLLLTAGFGLAVPTVFEHSLTNSTLSAEVLEKKSIDISRITAILLIIAYLVFVFFQARTHHGIYDNIFEGDEEKDRDREKDLGKPKLTLTECVIALAVSVTLVAIIAIALVDQIHFMVEERHISDAFVGLILVPLVEKAAEHLTAVDEAYDDQMNFALAHVLGATLQTALFNGPLVVIVGWGLGRPMGLNFEVFDLAVLLLAILTVGNFLRDQKSNYLEGFLCVIVYIAVAVAAAYYPNPESPHAEGVPESASPAGH